VRIAVLTLCRDRLAYTQHCFGTLRENAGCDFSHFVLDQGSHDGTAGWLLAEQAAGRVSGVVIQQENIGCTRGWNRLLDYYPPEYYDVIVCFDNDCEVVTENTLAVVAGLAAEHGEILAPRVQGLMHPPATISRFQLGAHTIDETTILGNIFMAIPSTVFADFRWDERYAVWDGGESVTQWHRDRGGRCGYVQGYVVNHYKTTEGQVADIPEYFARRVREGGRPK
jgi:GT2 family glycosyltransferase